MPFDWYAESLRVTFFVGNDRRQEALFATIAGTPPQETVERAPQHLRQDVGQVSGSRLAVVQQQGRVDVHLLGISQDTAFSWIGSFAEALKIFNPLVDKAAAAMYNPSRIAFAPTLILPADTFSAANMTLRSLLPLVTFDPANDTDIVWQINRRRPSRIRGTINRLAKWEVLQVQLVTISSTNAVPTATPIVAEPPVSAVRLSIDINTDPTITTAIVGTAIGQTLDELRAHAIEISEKGDIA